MALENEMNMWADKFEAYTREECPVQDILQQKKPTQGMGARSSSVGNRLFRQSKLSDGASSQEHQTIEDENECDGIKLQLEKIDHKIQRNGGLNCGWDAADHKDFLRIRTKHHDKCVTIAFMQELMRAVPGLDDEKFKEHITQFEIY